jgi:hypothetical protein
MNKLLTMQYQKHARVIGKTINAKNLWIKLLNNKPNRHKSKKPFNLSRK